jgi:hypothetical protein
MPTPSSVRNPPARKKLRGRLPGPLDRATRRTRAPLVWRRLRRANVTRAGDRNANDCNANYTESDPVRRMDAGLKAMPGFIHNRTSISSEQFQHVGRRQPTVHQRKGLRRNLRPEAAPGLLGLDHFVPDIAIRLQLRSICTRHVRRVRLLPLAVQGAEQILDFFITRGPPGCRTRCS